MGRPGTWGDDGTRQRTSEGNWRKPLRWNRLAGEGRLPDGSENPDGHRPRIFCASLADVFEPRPELDWWRAELFALIMATPNLDWLVLTKRPEVARDALSRRSFWETVGMAAGNSEIPGVREGPYSFEFEIGNRPNLCLGVSIENSRHTWRADVLREIPAAVRFISAEPLLGSLFQDRVPTPDTRQGHSAADALEGGADPVGRSRAPLDLSGIDWVIVGGESGGPKSRPMHPAWAREIRDAALDRCRACDFEADEVCSEPRPALYFKQWGSWSPSGIGDVLNTRLSGGLLPDGRRVSPAEAAETAGGEVMVYRGAAPTAGGKHLDGSPWCEFPQREMMPA